MQTSRSKEFIVNENYLMRTAIDCETGITYYSAVDLMDLIYDYEILTLGRNTWAVIKHRLKKNPKTAYLAACEKVNVLSADMKRHPTDMLTMQQAIEIVVYATFPKRDKHFESNFQNHVNYFDESSHFHSIQLEIYRMSKMRRDYDYLEFFSKNEDRYQDVVRLNKQIEDEENYKIAMGKS